MLIPFPGDDEPRMPAADLLREAQLLLGGSESDSAMLQVRKALEVIKNATDRCRAFMPGQVAELALGQAGAPAGWPGQARLVFPRPASVAQAECP